MLFGTNPLSMSPKNIFGLWGFCLFLVGACGAQSSFDVPPFELDIPEMSLGQLIPGPEVSIGAPRVVAGASLEEGMLVQVQTPGLAPVRLEGRMSGSWRAKGDGTLEWVIGTLEQSPDSGRMGEELELRLSSMKAPEYLPSDLLSLFSSSVGEHDVPLEKLSLGMKSEVHVEGVWRCLRRDGLLKSRQPAKELSCRLKDGYLTQIGQGPHKGRVLKSRVKGVFHGIRSGADGQSDAVGEELRMEMAAQAEGAVLINFKNAYYRIWQVGTRRGKGSGS